MKRRRIQCQCILLCAGFMLPLHESRADGKASPVANPSNQSSLDPTDASEQFLRGDNYATGQGVPKDEAEAVKWFRKAAGQGHVEAQFRLGCSYACGSGVPEDKVQAAQWYEKAAFQEHARAQYQLGVCYDRGKGVSKNQAEAIKWYRKSAAKGYAMAQITLGSGYELGIGVPKDRVTAYMWYDLAAASGDAAAKLWLDELSRQMTKDQIAEARRRSSEWRAAHAPNPK